MLCEKSTYEADNINEYCLQYCRMHIQSSGYKESIPDSRQNALATQSGPSQIVPSIPYLAISNTSAKTTLQNKIKKRSMVCAHTVVDPFDAK